MPPPSLDVKWSVPKMAREGDRKMDAFFGKPQYHLITQKSLNSDLQ